MCKAFLRMPPHLGLWLKTFKVKPKVVDGEHADSGDAMVSKLPHTTWPQGAFVDIVKTWQQEWFYITEPRGTKWAATPAFKSGSPLQLASWTNKGLDWGSSDEVLMLQKCIKSIIDKNICLTNVIQVPVKKDNKKKNKEAESDLRHEGTLDALSGGTEAPSSHEGDEDEDEEEEEEEEDDPPLKGKKRAQSADPEAGASKRGKLSLSDDSDSGAKAIPKPRSRAKPPAESPARDLPQQSSSSGDLPPEMMESETPPQASSPPRVDDLEVSSQRISPDRQEVRGTIKTAPEGNTSPVKGTGGTTPVGTGDGGPGLSGPQPNTVPETTPESTATTQAAEVSELKQKLKLADEDIVLMNKRLDEAQDGAAAVETLRGELAQAKEQARVSSAAADKAAADLKAFCSSD
nr:neurofilament heavy polypeptide-like [Aegilops tauschii subsp. strangulata]